MIKYNSKPLVTNSHKILLLPVCVFFTYSKNLKDVKEFKRRGMDPLFFVSDLSLKEEMTRK